MFFFGLDLHDLAPTSIFHLSAFVIVCEAFLKIQPHIGLWLQLFGVKLRAIDGKAPDCGGTSICKLNNPMWPTCTFIETVKE